MAIAWRRTGAPWVAGGAAITYATLLASYPAASYSGFQAFVSDLGTNGTTLRSNGTRWLVQGGQAVLKDMGAPIPKTTIANVETIVLQTLLPINSWQINDSLIFFLATTKSGTTDSLTLTARIGTGGTTSDTAITGITGNVFGSTILSGGVWFEIKLLTATSAQKISRGTNANTYIGTDTGAEATATTITSAAANALYLSIGIKSSSTNDTVGAQGGRIILQTP